MCVYTSQHGGGKQQTRHAMPFVVFLQDIVYYSTRLSMGRHSADKIGPTQLGSFHHRGSSVIPAQPTDPQHTLYNAPLVIIYKGGQEVGKIDSPIFPTIVQALEKHSHQGPAPLK